MTLLYYTTLLLLHLPHFTTQQSSSNPVQVTGEGFHRLLDLKLGSRFESALLKWEITPDFYIDVYELKRKGFQFRVDNGKTPFIEIEEPAHRSTFHSLSLNINNPNNSIPFHLRYQPAISAGVDSLFPYTSILIPGPSIDLILVDKSIRKISADPFEFKIPVANKSHLTIVTTTTCISLAIGTAYLINVIIKS